MQYFITFLEGVITFISPCMLPLLPVYVSFFAGSGDARDAGRRRVVLNALGFIAGFTLVFVVLGAFAGLLGGLLTRYQAAINIAAGAVVVAFGINYTGLIKIPFLNRARAGGGRRQITGFFSAALFGVIFSISWTPCAGAFLGSALMLASSRAAAAEGVILLLFYSLGLGVPFFISALLLETLKKAFDAVKKHYKVINAASGLLLIAMGVLMMTGTMGWFLRLMAF